MEIILIGSGAHLNVLIDALNSHKKYKICGYVSNKENKDLNLTYLGTDDDFKKQIKSKKYNFINGIG